MRGSLASYRKETEIPLPLDTKSGRHETEQVLSGNRISGKIMLVPETVCPNTLVRTKSLSLDKDPGWLLFLRRLPITLQKIY